MRFSISRTTQEGIQLIQLTDTLEQTRAAIAPAHGAMLHAFCLPMPGGSYNVIDNYSDLHQLQNELGSSFKSARLSPFPCRIREGKYLYEGEEMEFTRKEPDGAALHGLLYDKAFSIMGEWADDTCASVLLKYNYREEEDGYPFRYRCEVRYTLLPDAVLQVTTNIINLDELPLPVADGWHPYFRLEGDMSGWLLYFNADRQLELDDSLVPTGRLLHYPAFCVERPIGQTELNHCFLLNPGNGGSACSLRHPANGLRLDIYPDNAYPYLQLYTPPRRDSIAIESLSAPPDAFNNKIGLLLLAPGETRSFGVHYQLTCE
ncbi:MAG: aldose 1-epimerase [Bacteroidetes bacterium]|nr:aldose 1-epimerase [Bacteroidota bacterium]